MPTVGHDQSSYAALAIRASSWGAYPPFGEIQSKLKVQQTKARGFLATGAYIVKRETPLALYKGLGAVLSGIVPKMAIRFASFEAYKGWLADKSTGKTSIGNIFLGV